MDYTSLIRFMNFAHRIARPHEPTQISELFIIVTPGPAEPGAPRTIHWPQREVWRQVDPTDRSGQRGALFLPARPEDERYSDELRIRTERCRFHLREAWLSDAASDPRIPELLAQATAARLAAAEAEIQARVLVRLQEQEAFYRAQLGRPQPRAEDREHFARGHAALRLAVADTLHNQRVLEVRQLSAQQRGQALANALNEDLRVQLERWFAQPADTVDAAELIRLYRQFAVLLPDNARAASCMPDALRTQVLALRSGFVAQASRQVMPRFRGAVLAAAPQAASSHQLRNALLVFGRQDELNQAFLNDDPSFRDAVVKRIAALEAREAEEIRQRRRELIAMRLRDNPAPDAATLTRAWTRASLRQAQTLHQRQEGAVQTALPFLDLLMGGRFEQAGDDSYCYMRNTLRGSRCEFSLYITVTSPSCTRVGRQQRCRFMATYSGEPGPRGEEALVSWNAEGELDVAADARPLFMSVEWTRSRGRPSGGGRGPAMSDILMDRDVDNRMNYENRQRETMPPGRRWEAYDPGRRY
jgi:hypothetical protein